MNQRVQERLLKVIGIACTTVENGLAGIEYLTETKPSRLIEFDLVLMDCHMPVMDGFEASRKIRELEKKFSLPRKHIIAITAGQSIEECYDAGMCAVISKPVNKQTLSSVLTDHFNRPCSCSCRPSS